MIITLNPKDKLVVRFEGTDGEFEIHFDSSELPQQLVVRETAGLSGNRAGVANSTLYHDDWTRTNRGWRNTPLTKPAEPVYDAAYFDKQGAPAPESDDGFLNTEHGDGTVTGL